MKILVLNCGSSSLKFQLINMENNERLAKGNFERIGGMKTTLKLNVGGKKEELVHIARDYDEAISFVLEVLLKPEYNIINSLDEITAVGHRIVHGGEMFSKSVLITEDVIKEIEKCIDLAPLHNPAGVAGIKAAKNALPNVPMVAVFDTAFHQTMPAKAYIYQIPLNFIPGVGGKTIEKLLSTFETEMNILHKLSEDDIEAIVGEKVAKNIVSAREGKAKVESGGGGNYGKVTVS